MAKHWFPLVTLGSVAGLFASLSAGAVTTSYPGTQCIQAITLSPQLVYQGARVSTTSLSSSAFIICPAVQQGGRLLSASVSGRDIDSSTSISCFAEAKNQFDTAAFFTSSASSTNGNFTLNFGALGATQFFANGSKLIECTRPPAFGPDGSSVGSYVIREQ